MPGDPVRLERGRRMPFRPHPIALESSVPHELLLAAAGEIHGEELAREDASNTVLAPWPSTRLRQPPRESSEAKVSRLYASPPVGWAPRSQEGKDVAGDSDGSRTRK